jgi:hypothetical protein
MLSLEKFVDLAHPDDGEDAFIDLKSALHHSHTTPPSSHFVQNQWMFIFFYLSINCTQKARYFEVCSVYVTPHPNASIKPDIRKVLQYLINISHICLCQSNPSRSMGISLPSIPTIQSLLHQWVVELTHGPVNRTTAKNVTL